MIIDAKHAILGRVASKAAKALLRGEEVEIYNILDIIITGNPEATKKKYLTKISRGSPQHGPFLPRKPDLLLRRTIRGMLPYKKKRGREALRKLKIYFEDVPEGVKAIKSEKTVSANYITFAELCKTIGWKTWSKKK